MHQRIVLTGAMMALISAGMAQEGEKGTSMGSIYGAVETYRQVLLVKSRPDAGALSAPQLAGVYDGRKWALSTRWDDSNPNALNVRGKMLENGIRGTFYLNSRKVEKPAGSLARQLTGNGECSVGGHSVSHPRLPELPANEAFYELMANRVALEFLTDRPVNSLAFPYGSYQDKNRPEVLEGITAAFLRSGYHHCVYMHFVTKNPFLPENLVSTGLQVVPGDRQVNAEKFWQHVEKIREFEKGYRKTSDCIFLGVHPWQKGDELERLGEVLGKLRDWDDFWHCTQTEYAAFTKQRRNTTVSVLEPGKFELQRPCGFELGNDIPLTLVFEGEAVHAAEVDGAACSVRQAGGKTFVNLPHAPRFGAPSRIDQTAGGDSAKFAGLRTSLTFDKVAGKLAYELENATGTDLSDVHLTVSLPPVFEPGILRRKRAQLANSTSWSVETAVAKHRTGDYWTNGRRYFVAQLDFSLQNKRGRLFTTCTIIPE